MDEEGPSKKKAKMYIFHLEWENEFLFTTVKDKTVCLICQQSVALPKKGNLERQHSTMHSKFKDTYPPSSLICSRKAEEMKSLLKAQQSFFTRPLEKGKANTEASFCVSHLLAKHKNHLRTESCSKKQCWSHRIHYLETLNIKMKSEQP